MSLDDLRGIPKPIQVLLLLRSQCAAVRASLCVQVVGEINDRTLGSPVLLWRLLWLVKGLSKPTPLYSSTTIQASTDSPLVRTTRRDRMVLDALWCRVSIPATLRCIPCEALRVSASSIAETPLELCMGRSDPTDNDQVLGVHASTLNYWK